MSEKENNITPREPDKKDKLKKKEKKANILVRAIRAFPRWFREMRSELKKVVWPMPKQILNNTWIVIVMVIVVGACIWIFDALAGTGVNALIGAFAG